MRPHFLLAFIASSACVWEPAHQSTHDRTQPLDVRGWARNRDTPIVVEAWNHVTQQYEVVGSTRSSMDPNFESPSLYFYFVDDIPLTQAHWIPAGAPCSTSGMASLRVLERSSPLATFEAAQRDCVFAEVYDGAHPVNAAYECGSSTQLVLFSPPTC